MFNNGCVIRANRGQTTVFNNRCVIRANRGQTTVHYCFGAHSSLWSSYKKIGPSKILKNIHRKRAYPPDWQFLLNVKTHTGVSGMSPQKHIRFFESASNCNISLLKVQHFSAEGATFRTKYSYSYTFVGGSFWKPDCGLISIMRPNSVYMPMIYT